MTVLQALVIKVLNDSDAILKKYLPRSGAVGPVTTKIIESRMDKKMVIFGYYTTKQNKPKVIPYRITVEASFCFNFVLRVEFFDAGVYSSKKSIAPKDIRQELVEAYSDALSEVYV